MPLRPQQASPCRVLIAEDNALARRGLGELVRSWGYDVVEAADGQAALESALVAGPSAAVVDLVMPRLDGLGLLQALQARAPLTAVILLTGHASVETAVSAMRCGAYDYLTKPVEVERLKVLLQKAVNRGRTQRGITLVRRLAQNARDVNKLLGTSQVMQDVHGMIELAAATQAPVFIVGASGTGKECAARAIHELSPRRAGPFVAVNCSAIPDTLLESEIFGHERGAFTGAVERRVGCFELAHQGTLLLDEVAEMSPNLQAKFLRILEDGLVQRLGSPMATPVDVRVLAATNRDVSTMLADGTLRQDLFYRLNVFTLSLPPLRERMEDLPLLVEAFIEEFNLKYGKHVTSLDLAALALLQAHPWPGNVRELRNTIERALVACEGDLIVPGDLPPGLQGDGRNDPTGSVVVPVGSTVDDAEKALILMTLATVGGNKTRAARVLGISLKTLHNKLRRYAG